MLYLIIIQQIHKKISEFDYHAEGLNLLRARNAVMPVWGQRVVVPSPYLEYCSKHILVMELLDGEKLVDGIRSYYHKLAHKLCVNINDLEKDRVEAIKNGNYKFKSIEDENNDVAHIKRLTFLYDMFLTANIFRFVYNYSIFRFFNGPLTYYKTEQPPELGKLLDLLCRVHGVQLFKDGAFNSDPHPGNCL